MCRSLVFSGAVSSFCGVRCLRPVTGPGPSRRPEAEGAATSGSTWLPRGWGVREGVWALHPGSPTFANTKHRGSCGLVKSNGREMFDSSSRWRAGLEGLCSDLSMATEREHLCCLWEAEPAPRCRCLTVRRSLNRPGSKTRS